MRFLLVPLDERPVSAHLPAQIARIAGIRVEVPPASAMPRVRHAGDTRALDAWLDDAAPGADGAVVSLEGLGFGGLISSRIGHESAVDVLSRWEALQRIAAPVYGSVVVPRTPDTLDAYEEPDYWSQWGPELHALGNRIDDAPSDTSVPDDVRADWLRRRLRQHTLALASLGLVADGVIDRLFIGVDDSTPGSLSADAQRDLARWSRRLGHGDRVAVAPGADETAAVLTARLTLESLDVERPRVALVSADDDGLERIASYETGSIGDTARAQLESAGAVVLDAGAAADAEAVFVTHAPQTRGGDWALSPKQHRDPVAAARTVALVAHHVRAGRAVAVADAAQPNGGDPALIDALSRANLLARVDGYAGWNTAANTIGTAAAQVVTVLAARRAGRFDAAASARLTRLRILEDFAYMSVARATLRAELGSPNDRHDRVDDELTGARIVAGAINAAVTALPGEPFLGRVRADDVSFPWRRSFEIALNERAGDAREENA